MDKKWWSVVCCVVVAYCCCFSKCLSLNSILAKREMIFLLLLLLGLQLFFEGGQSTTHSTGLLDTQIQRNILLLLVEKTKLFTLSLVDNGQCTGNVLASQSTNNKNYLLIIILFYYWSHFLLLISYLLCTSYHINIFPPFPFYIYIYIYILHLVKLGSRTASDLLNTQGSKFLLLLVKSLQELSLVLVAKFVCFDGSL